MIKKLDSISLWDKMVLPRIHIDELEKVVKYTHFGPKIVHINGYIDA